MVDEEQYRKSVEKKYIDTANEIDRHRREYLELRKQQLDLMLDWTTTVSILCFAIGGAVVPLINQFSTQGSVAHPNLLFAAALILITNGAVILILKKHRIEKGVNRVNVINLPYEIILRKTLTVLSDFLQYQTTRKHIDRRYDEQYQELIALTKELEQEDKVRPTMELDAYLGVMLLGFACIFGSVIDNSSRLVMYGVVVFFAALGYATYILFTYYKVKEGIAERERLQRELKDAEQYKVPPPSSDSFAL